MKYLIVSIALILAFNQAEAQNQASLSSDLMGLGVSAPLASYINDSVSSHYQISNLNNAPDITYSDLDYNNRIINRRRDAHFYEIEEEFRFWNFGCETSYTAYEYYSNFSGAPTFTTTNHLCSYTKSSTAATYGHLLGNTHLPTAQLVATVTVESLNAIGTYNDIIVGFGLADTETATDPNGYFYATYRRTLANPTGYIEAGYRRTTAGGSGFVFNSATLSTALTPPFKLGLILNHNSLASFIEKDGRQYITLNKEIVSSDHNLQLTATVAKLRPMLKFQSDDQINATISSWEVRAMGSLGDREHQVVTYENGEPIKDKNGYYYIMADATGPTTGTINPATDSPLDRNTCTLHLYNPIAGRFVKTVAKYAQIKGAKTFGAQECNILFDRNTGKFHWWTSEWNDHSDPVSIWHYETYDNILGGYWVIPDSVASKVNLNSLHSVFASYDQYDQSVIYHGGKWYMSGTVLGNPATGGARSGFLVSGTSPTTWTKFEFLDNEVTEGSRMWHVGGNLYFASGLGSTTMKLLSMTGTELKRWELAGGGAFPHQAALLPFVRFGKTQYQVLTFSDYNNQEEFYSDFNSQLQTVAFGPTVVVDMGTFTGEEFSVSERRFQGIF